MLESLDRVQFCTNDPKRVTDRWTKILDAAVSSTDKVKALCADRVTLNVGSTQIEILSPDGEGEAADHLREYPGGPFAAGFACVDIDRLEHQLSDLGIRHVMENGQIYLNSEALGIPGLRLVISPVCSRPPQGLMKNLYEVTHLTDQVAATIDTFSRLFSQNADNFVPIHSENYGYEGYLTLVDARRLDRIEVINPYDLDKTMGRYFNRFGASLYMCYGETDNLPEIRRRLMEYFPDDWTGPTEGTLDGLFVHPKGLGGSMLGISRTTFAWSWSGYPERIQPL